MSLLCVSIVFEVFFPLQIDCHCTSGTSKDFGPNRQSCQLIIVCRLRSRPYSTSPNTSYTLLQMNMDPHITITHSVVEEHGPSTGEFSSMLGCRSIQPSPTAVPLKTSPPPPSAQKEPPPYKAGAQAPAAPLRRRACLGATVKSVAEGGLFPTEVDSDRWRVTRKSTANAYRI